MKDIKGLTGLRGFAALWVCVFHYMPNTQLPTFTVKLLQFGAQGVIVFFILSGFILSYVYRDTFSRGVEPGRYRHFLLLRIARIYPLQIVTLLIVALLIIAQIIPLRPNDTWYTFGLNLLLLHAWGFTNGISWNQPSWSISIEAFAYLLLPFVIAPLSRLRAPALSVLLACVFLALIYDPYGAAVRLVAGHFGFDTSTIQFAFGISLLAFVGDFMFGAVLFFLADRIRGRLPAVAIYDAAVLTGIALIAYWSLTDALRGVRIVVASGLIIFGLYRDAGIGKVIFGNRLSVFLGDISYALYLSHDWLIWLWTPLLMRFVPNTWFHMVPLSLRVAVAVAVATLLHYAVERPMRNFLRRRWSTPSARSLRLEPVASVLDVLPGKEMTR